MNAVKMSGLFLGASILTAAWAEPPKIAGHDSNFREARFSRRASLHYGAFWGVEGLQVKLVGSGELVRFSWHVLDAEKASPLNDKKSMPSLIDPQAGVSLVVPEMEQVGMLRQSATPEAGKSYWMAFSNKGMHVRRGDRVSIMIGKFRADNLLVE